TTSTVAGGMASETAPGAVRDGRPAPPSWCRRSGGAVLSVRAARRHRRRLARHEHPSDHGRAPGHPGRSARARRRPPRTEVHPRRPGAHVPRRAGRAGGRGPPPRPDKELEMTAEMYRTSVEMYRTLAAAMAPEAGLPNRSEERRVGEERRGQGVT